MVLTYINTIELKIKQIPKITLQHSGVGGKSLGTSRNGQQKVDYVQP